MFANSSIGACLGEEKAGTYVNDTEIKQEPKTDQKQSTTTNIGQDMWKQLKRVQIPIFSGKKRQYGSRNAAFLACIDQAPATADYKLRQYLSGEALKCIEILAILLLLTKQQETRKKVWWPQTTGGHLFRRTGII